MVNPLRSQRGDNPYFSFGVEKFDVILCQSMMQNLAPKLGIKHPCGKFNKVCSNEGSHPFPRGDNMEVHWGHLKIFFRTTANINQT